jgi:hypothetical protein
MNSLQTQDTDMIEAKFISKVVTMGPERFFLPFPKEMIKTAKSLRGKYVKVSIQEITLDEK